MSASPADALRAEPMLAAAPLPARTVVVGEIRREAEDVVSLLFVDPQGGELPAWEPGAHLDVRVTAEIERQYSLCGDPDDRSGYRVAVLREPQSRGGSERIHAELRVGDQIAVRGPRNHFPLVPAPSYRFIAGGIGITPILPMIARAQAWGADWRLLYGGRRSDSMAFLEVLEGYGERVRVRPEDQYGLLDLAAELADVEPETLVYCCGPGPLLDAVERHSAELLEGALRIERFTPREPIHPAAADRGITVECARSGLTVEVDAQTTILEALRDAGVEVDSSCEEGTCGTCETRVLAGRPEHRDSILSEAERREDRVMMVCCSRAKGDHLVLDL